MQFLRHLLFPHHSNNFRAKIIHNSSLVALIFAFLFLAGGIHFLKQSHPAVLGISYSITVDDLLTDTNNARTVGSKQPLVLNAQLSDAARRKAANMFQNNYWAHFGPDGTTPWSFIKAAGYDYAYAGENLAKGFTTSQDVVNAWMNSPSHRENVLSDKYKDVGFAVVEGNLQGEDTVLVVQMFGSLSAEPQSNPVQQVASQPEAKVSPVPQPQVEALHKTDTSVQIPNFTRTITVGFLVFIIAILALDIIIVERRKIPRIVGHNLDHLILLVLFLVFLILYKTGGVL